MAYSPPVTFTANTTISAPDYQENSDALRVYLHDGIVSGDLRASRWIDTRHVQSPLVDSYRGLQTGATGIQGGQDSGGPLTRATLTSSYLTGGKYGAVEWIPVPGSAIRISVRRPCKALFHYRWEIIAGPDDAPNISGRIPDQDERLVTISPYIGNLTQVQVASAQDTVNNYDGWVSTPPSPERVYNLVGWGSKTGTLFQNYTGVGEYVLGLASFSQIDRSAILNWSVAVECWYV